MGWNGKLLACMGILLVILFPLEGEASQLNMYQGPNCTGPWKPCWDRECCNVMYNGSFRFYYNDGWPAYLYNVNDCQGKPANVFRNTIECTNGFPYKSIKQTDTNP